MVNWLNFLISLWLKFTPAPIATTEYGKIEGLHYVTPDGFATQMFMGIPYAKPPINELRFEVGLSRTSQIHKLLNLRLHLLIT